MNVNFLCIHADAQSYLRGALEALSWLVTTRWGSTCLSWRARKLPLAKRARRAWLKGKRSLGGAAVFRGVRMTQHREGLFRVRRVLQEACSGKAMCATQFVSCAYTMRSGTFHHRHFSSQHPGRRPKWLTFRNKQFGEKPVGTHFNLYKRLATYLCVACDCACVLFCGGPNREIGCLHVRFAQVLCAVLALTSLAKE